MIYENSNRTIVLLERQTYFKTRSLNHGPHEVMILASFLAVLCCVFLQCNMEKETCLLRKGSVIEL